MRVHIVRDGVVENTIIADSLYEVQQVYPDAFCMDGDFYAGGPGCVLTSGPPDARGRPTYVLVSPDPPP